MVDFAVPADYRVKLKESEKWNKYLDLVRELKKNTEHEGNGDTSYNWCTWKNTQRIGKETRRLRNQLTSRASRLQHY